MNESKLSYLEDLALDRQRFRPAYKIEFLVRAMMAQGVAPELVLANTGLTKERLHSTDTRISMPDLVKVYTNVQNYSSDPAIALQVGKQINTGCYGVYGNALLSFPTMRQALLFSIDFHSIVTRTVRMELIEHQDEEYASLRFYDLLHDPNLFRFNMEFQLGIVLALFRDILGDQSLAFKKALVAYAAPGHAHQYSELLACPVLFSQPENEYQFDKFWLDMPLPRANALALEALLKACEVQLSEWCKGDGLLIAVRKIIQENLGSEFSAEMVAMRLNMTSRTLRRRLAERGTNFREMLGNLRIRQAQDYLTGSKMTMDEIAARLGYSDTTNFRHAFKRSVGITPGDYRRQNL